MVLLGVLGRRFHTRARERLSKARSTCCARLSVSINNLLQIQHPPEQPLSPAPSLVLTGPRFKNKPGATLGRAVDPPAALQSRTWPDPSSPLGIYEEERFCTGASSWFFLAMQSQVFFGWGKWGVNVLWLQCWVFRGDLLLSYSPGCFPAPPRLPDSWKPSASGLNLIFILFFLNIGGG